MELLKKHFNTALESPDGIIKLRELILTLAIQGKLVKQEPHDQPASELLKEIQAEKERLVRNGVLRKQNTVGVINSNMIPYVTPKSWEWVRLEGICTLITDGTHLTPNYIDSGIPFLSVKNLSSGNINFSDTKFISPNEHKELTKRCKPELNDILLTKIGTTGIAVRVNTDKEFSIFVSVALIKFVNTKTNPQFLEMLINSPLVKKYSKDGTEGVGNKNLVLRKIREYLIPIPPLAEQKRIVAKIEELMALCDKLEAQRKTRNNKRLAVHTSAINRLLKADDKNDFDNSWQFITHYFDPLYGEKENVAELKKAILTLAMQGKLVKQDPNDQPASELLKEIQAEKERLIKEGKIKRQKELPPITPLEEPYEVPEGWVPVLLGEIGFWKSGSTPSRTNSKYYGGDIPWVKSGEVKKGRISKTEEYITTEALNNCALSINEKGSVLVAMYGANIGEVGILDIPATTNQAVCACKTYKQFNESYLLHLISSLKPYFLSKGAGAAQPNISREKIIATPILLPPLAEQKRIVAKIDELMALCNKLENQIDQATAKQTALFDAVLAEV